MKSIYLSAEFGRQEELRRYAKDILLLKRYQVTSRWLENDPAEDAASDEERQKELALEDIDDLIDTDLLVVFTPGSARGGRHVELGYALAMGTTVWLVGPAENFFHQLADKRFGTWNEALTELMMLSADESIKELREDMRR